MWSSPQDPMDLSLDRGRQAEHAFVSDVIEQRALTTHQSMSSFEEGHAYSDYRIDSGRKPYRCYKKTGGCRSLKVTKITVPFINGAAQASCLPKRLNWGFPIDLNCTYCTTLFGIFA